MAVRVLLAPSADLAREVLSAENVPLTVEAEYGSFVAEGTVYTAAHHQPKGTTYAGTHVGGTMPSPCNDPKVPFLQEGVILVSHVDLDTFGGVLRALGTTSLFGDSFEGFWKLAEFVDTRGTHKIGQSGASEMTIRSLNAYYAWAKSVPRFPRDTVTDITKWVEAAGDALSRILEREDPELLAAGDAMEAATADFNARSFRRRTGDVLVRVSPEFCNHLYVSPEGDVGRAVASYNPKTGAVTVSLADPVPGVSCRSLVQNLWGPEAGGHDGIAGSPRESDLGEQGLDEAVRALDLALRQ